MNNTIDINNFSIFYNLPSTSGDVVVGDVGGNVGTVGGGDGVGGGSFNISKMKSINGAIRVYRPSVAHASR